MEVELEFKITVDGTPKTFTRTLKNGSMTEEFCADIQHLRQTVTHLMKEHIAGLI